MRITIEPTEAYNGNFPQQTVTISVPNDNMHVGEAVELMKNALIAWGYHPDSVADWIP